MKLFLMFIPLILVYSQEFISTNEKIINGQSTKIPIYYLNLKNIYNQMIDSCIDIVNNNDCKPKILDFLNNVFNNTIDFSTSIEEIYNKISTIILRYPNPEMIKKEIFQYLNDLSLNIYKTECMGFNLRNLKEDSFCSTILGNTLCRLFHVLCGDDPSDCDY